MTLTEDNIRVYNFRAGDYSLTNDPSIITPIEVHVHPDGSAWSPRPTRMKG